MNPNNQQQLTDLWQQLNSLRSNLSLLQSAPAQGSPSGRSSSPVLPPATNSGYYAPVGSQNFLPQLNDNNASYQNQHYTPYQSQNHYSGYSTGYNSGYQGHFYPHRGRYRGRYRGSARGGHRGRYPGRGGFVAKPKVRNMSLIVNNNAPANTADGSSENNGTEYVSTVRKNIMQLVNKSALEQQEEERTRKAKILDLKKRILQAEIERKTRFQKLERNRTKYDYCDWENIYGNQSEAGKKGYGLYAVVNNGQKLVPLSLDPKSEGVNELVTFNNKQYLRSSDGSLVSTNPNTSGEIYCRYFTSTGICQRGTMCPYKHSKDHVALCRAFISNRCSSSAETCHLSHKPNEHNVPTCRFFLNGYCSKSECMFGHVKTSLDAKICRPFSIGGWCNRGFKCPYKHLYTCPDMTDYGTCSRGRACKLSHAVKKSDMNSSNAISTNNTSVPAVDNQVQDTTGVSSISEILGYSSEIESECDSENSSEEESDCEEEAEEAEQHEVEDKEHWSNADEESKELEQNQDYVQL